MCLWFEDMGTWLVTDEFAQNALLCMVGWYGRLFFVAIKDCLNEYFCPARVHYLDQK